MAYGKISKKQQEILDYMKNEILNRGFPPSVREICEAVNLKSTSSVHSHLEALEKNGYIRRDATKPRAIEIIDDNFNLVRREVVNVPLIGTVAAGQPVLAVENIEGLQFSCRRFWENQVGNFVLVFRALRLLGCLSIGRGLRTLGLGIAGATAQCHGSCQQDCEESG